MIWPPFSGDSRFITAELAEGMRFSLLDFSPVAVGLATELAGLCWSTFDCWSSAVPSGGCSAGLATADTGISADLDSGGGVATLDSDTLASVFCEVPSPVL